MTSPDSPTTPQAQGAANTLIDRIRSAPERMQHDPGRGDLAGTGEYRIIVSAEERDYLAALLSRTRPPAGAEGVEPHVYISTACFHGLHNRCRKTCKFCSTHCRCACHGVTLPSAEQSKVADAVLSRAMDLLDDVIGTLDKQTSDLKQLDDLELPEDAEFEVTITVGQERNLSDVWHLLSGLLKNIRTPSIVLPSAEQAREEER